MTMVSMISQKVIKGAGTRPRTILINFLISCQGVVSLKLS